MAVTVTPWNHTTLLILQAAFGLTPQIDKANLRFKLLTNAASFVATHTSVEQVDNGSKATVTMTIATPGVISDTAHGLAAGTPVAFLSTGALPTGLTPGTFYYVIATGLTTNTYQISATPGGAAIATSGTQSGVHTRYAGGSYETYGNGWPAGGFTLASLAASAANLDAGANVNDAILTAVNPVQTATGGPLPPVPSYKSVFYDASTMKPLLWIDHGQAQQAGITTDFKFLINAAGILNLQTT